MRVHLGLLPFPLQIPWFLLVSPPCPWGVHHLNFTSEQGWDSEKLFSDLRPPVHCLRLIFLKLTLDYSPPADGSPLPILYPSIQGLPGSSHTQEHSRSIHFLLLICASLFWELASGLYSIVQAVPFI